MRATLRHAWTWRPVGLAKQVGAGDEGHPGQRWIPKEAPNHYVTDTAGALNEGTRDWVESDLQSYEVATGHQVIVWIGQTTGGVPLETWTSETANKWKIGRRGRTILPRMRHGDVNGAISLGILGKRWFHVAPRFP